MNLRAWLMGIAAFCMSLANAIIALPKGEEIFLADILISVPAMCFLLALGNGIFAAIGIKKPQKEN